MVAPDLLPSPRLRKAGSAVVRALLSALLWTGCSGQDENEASPAEVAGTGAAPWFVEVDGSGLSHRHESGGEGQFWLPEIMGPGVSLFDPDNDGDLDLYLVNGNENLPGVDVSERHVNHFYRHTSPFVFQDETEGSGLANGGYGMGSAIGDYDNDGFVDVYVMNHGPDALYANRSGHSFEDVTGSLGVSVPGWSCSAAFLDYDRDGFLDLFVTQYVHFDPDKTCSDRAGRHDYCGPKVFEPAVDVLLRNDGGGRMIDVSHASGIDSLAAAGLGVALDDFDDDGWIDVYVANDGYANHLWLNQADGVRFEEKALLYGLAHNASGQAEAGMGVVSTDFDGDGRPDLFVTHLNQESNTYYRHVQAGSFSDATGLSGLAANSMALTGFGVIAFDAELDGDDDLFVVNGQVARGDARPESQLPPPWDRYAQPNLFYLNNGRGIFTLAPDEGHRASSRVEISRGVAMGDLDHDGDVDFVLTNTQGPAHAYRNEAPRSGNWLLLRVRDERLKRDALGARVLVRCGPRTYRKVVNPSLGYVSASDVRLHFGLGDTKAYDSIDVRWPDGSEERFDGGPTDRSVGLVRGTGTRLP